MPPRVTVYIAPGNNRSRIVGEAMFAGMRAAGEDAELKSSASYRGLPRAEVAVFYGLAGGLRRVLADYREKRRRAIYIDLGYWGRRKKTRWDGFHKMVLNARHPTAYFQAKPHPPDRFAQFGIAVEPWRSEGRHILIAGMSAKAAAAEGLRPEQWERATIARLRQITKRPLIYRPKPNWIGARPISGSTFDPERPLAAALRDCHAVVAHHSNVAVDALIAGIPVHCPLGVASVLGEPELAKIENPRMPDGRAQWAADLAYCQFSLEEMTSGVAWRTLIAEGVAS